DGIRDFHVTGVQTCALPIYQHYTLNPELLLVFEGGDPQALLLDNMGQPIAQFLGIMLMEFLLNPLLNLLLAPLFLRTLLSLQRRRFVGFRRLEDQPQTIAFDCLTHQDKAVAARLHLRVPQILALPFDGTLAET